MQGAPVIGALEELGVEPHIRWIRTPGHSDGLISLLIDTDGGLVVIASDCVGPLPEYFDEMALPEGFGPERDEPLGQWRRIREPNRRWSSRGTIHRSGCPR